MVGLLVIVSMIGLLICIRLCRRLRVLILCDLRVSLPIGLWCRFFIDYCEMGGRRLLCGVRLPFISPL